ncbi:MAG: phosphopantetheine-binding protein [Citricoccus sp.]|nr:phosphopantetheine-binding protein [Citricoccus sp. WCRC_4]
MNEHDARAAVYAAISQVAPDVETDGLDDRSRLRQDLELDSLDFLALVEHLARRAGVDVPESDYGRVGTVAALIAYVAEHA